MDETEVAAFVRRAQSGDAESLTRLVEYFHPRVFRYCLARVGQVPLADDITQEVSVALMSAVSSYRDTGRPFGAYVFGIAANKVAMALRSESRRREILSDAEVERPDLGIGPEERVVAAEQTRELNGLLSALSERQRDLVLLRVVGGLSAQEVAALYGISTGAVRVAQHRALTALRGLAAEYRVVR